MKLGGDILKRKLLISLIEEPDPSKYLFSFIEHKCPESINLKKLIDFYYELENQISRLELWLYDIWGINFYKQLFLSKDKTEFAINMAFRIAKEYEANILICDGFSIREAIVIKRLLKEVPINIEIGYSPAPTHTNNVAEIIFGCKTMIDAFSNPRFIYGKYWNMDVVRDIKNPPRIGAYENYALWSYDPDMRLHQAEKYNITLHRIGDVIGDILKLIKHLLSVGKPLIVTGDHGYIFLGKKPNNALWPKPKKASRCYEEREIYEDLFVEVHGKNIAIGRKHAKPSKGSFITHGGISLTESMIPILLLRNKDKY